MSNDKSVVIRPATHADSEQMIKICAENLIENNRQNDLSKTGFLIRKLTLLDTKEMIDDQQNYFVCVAEKNDEVLGYLIGCDIAVSGINFPENIFDLKNEKIFYHKQIVKKVGTKNIGEKLLLSMFDEARNRGYLRVICRIVHQPFYNELSVSFHQKFGFKEIAAMVEDSPSLNLVMGIYLRTL